MVIIKCRKRKQNEEGEEMKIGGNEREVQIQIQIQIIYFQSDVTYSKNIRNYHSDRGRYCRNTDWWAKL